MRSPRSGLHSSCGGRKQTLFSQIHPPAPFKCESASCARKLEQEGTGKSLPLGDWNKMLPRMCWEKRPASWVWGGECRGLGGAGGWLWEGVGLSDPSIKASSLQSCRLMSSLPGFQRRLYGKTSALLPTSFPGSGEGG